MIDNNMMLDFILAEYNKMLKEIKNNISINSSNTLNERTIEKINNSIDSLPCGDKRFEMRIRQMLEDINIMINKYKNLFDDYDINIIKNNEKKLKNILNIREKIYNDRINNRSKFEEYIKSNHVNETLTQHMREIFNNDMKLYREFLNEYKKVRYIQDSLINYTSKIWESELTDPNKYIHGQPFKFLIHSLTHKSEVTPENIVVNKPIINSSLITDRHLEVFGSNYGFVYPFKKENIILIGKDDLYADIFDSKVISPDIILDEWISRDKIFKYTTIESSKTMTPFQIEEDNLSRCEDRNKKNLNCDSYNSNNKIINEIVLRNNEANRPIAIFYITNGDEDFNTNSQDLYKKAKKLSQQHNLKLIVIYKPICRIKANLSILTLEDEANIYKNLSFTCNYTYAKLWGDVKKQFLLFKDKSNYDDKIINSIYKNEIFKIYANIFTSKGNMSFEEFFKKEVERILVEYKID